jgi:hypothetical protein
MSHNPYAPPKADIGRPAASATASGVPLPVDQMFSPEQIAAGAFLGSPLAAGWLVAHNFRVMRQPQEAGRALGLCMVATLVTILIATYVPGGVPMLALPVVYTIVAYRMAQTRFRSVIAAHREAGGTMRSWWRTAGIASLCALIVIVVAVEILPSLLE